MSDHARRATIVALILIAVMSLLPPAMIGGQRGAIWKFFYDFQNLLAGLAAIAAAGLTVWQMRRSDAQQWARHQREMNASTLRDRLAVLRLDAILSPQLEGFKSACTAFDIPIETGFEEPIWTAATRSSLFRAAYACKGYRGQETSVRIATCAHLFTPEMDRSISLFETWTKGIVDYLPDDAELARLLGPGGRPDWYEPYIGMALRGLGEGALEYRDALDDWGLELLGAEWSFRRTR
ncbi:hypothetical protein J2W92_002302 [Rhizobium leguminosarum]